MKIENSGFDARWLPGIVTKIEDDYTNSHRVRFKSPAFFDQNENVAMRLGDGSRELKPGDNILVLNLNPEYNNVFFYVPVMIDGNNKIEMYSGIKENSQSNIKEKTNHIDLTYSGVNGDNSSKEILVKSDNRITIKCGGNEIVADGKSGTIEIKATPTSGVGSGITILGNVNIVGTLNVSGDVIASKEWSLRSHQHLGALAYPITPAYPKSLFSMLNSVN